MGSSPVRFRPINQHMFSNRTKSVVGLDIEAGSVAATEVEFNGTARVTKTAIGSLPPGAFDEGEVVDSEALGGALRTLFAEHKLAKTVRLGIANQRVSVRAMHLPLIEDPDELDTAVRFQAQDQLPMPLDEAVLDYQVVGKGTNEDGDRQMDLVAVAARRDMLVALSESMRAAGLRPVGIDLSAFAMIRALSGEADDAGTTLYCHLGDVTNLAVAKGSACLFARTAQFGIEDVAERLAERREMSLDEARRQLILVGLEGEPEQAAGELEVEAARETLSEGVTKLVSELRLSLEFYGAQEGAEAVERLVLCGPGSTIPGVADRLERELGFRVDEERPSALGSLEDREAARLTVSYGLALEEAPA